jgi:hypothetical protein
MLPTDILGYLDDGYHASVLGWIGRQLLGC